MKFIAIRYDYESVCIVWSGGKGELYRFIKGGIL